MNAFFYPRLALSGMRRDRRIYAPYLAACVFMTAVVYDLAFLADSPALYAVGSGVNGMGTSAIRLVMTLGKWVMAVFALLFFFYTNAFLIRRRKKELGLMSVLGMDRGALASLLFWETAFSAATASASVLPDPNGSSSFPAWAFSAEPTTSPSPSPSRSPRCSFSS